MRARSRTRIWAGAIGTLRGSSCRSRRDPVGTAPGYGSDLVVDLLRAVGIEYVALNPGATYRGLHDSLVNYGGNRAPELVLTTHEEIAVAMAHGYAKARGAPMAAVVHDIVGLQHASMAIFNAFCDRAPVLVLGASGPMDATRRRPWIDWIHTALVQGTGPGLREARRPAGQRRRHSGGVPARVAGGADGAAGAGLRVPGRGPAGAAARARRGPAGRGALRAAG